jgi:hypothetical protein
MDPRAAHILGRYILAAGLAVAAVPTLLEWGGRRERTPPAAGGGRV